MLTQKDKDTLWELIEPVRAAMFTTHDGENLYARPMTHVNDEFDGVLYYFTRLNSEKVDELQRNSHVGLTYVDHDKNNHVSLTGTAEITRDQALIDKYWNSFVAAWFPEGKDSPVVTLLKVHVEKAEYWDSPSSKVVQLFHIAKANLTDSFPNMGENKKLG